MWLSVGKYTWSVRGTCQGHTACWWLVLKGTSGGMLYWILKQGQPHTPPSPLSQACVERGQHREEEGKGRFGVWSVFLTLLLSCFPAPTPRPGFRPSLPAPVSPWVSGGGKAQVFAKLMTCLCAKHTGGWTSTQTLLMASRPLCWRPRSPALAPCRLRPLLTPMPVAPAPAPRSTPEPPRAPLPTPLGS